MAEWHMPFAPPQHYQAEETVAEAQVVKREWDPNNFVICSHCREPITHGRQGMDFTPGVAGWGTKSGRPMLVDSADLDHSPATLHYDCITPYVLGEENKGEYGNRPFEPAEGYDDEPQFCAGCEAQLVDADIVLCHLCGEPLAGEAPRFCANCGGQVPR